MVNTNQRETGSRKLATPKGPDNRDGISQDAAANKKPADGQGNSAPVNEVLDKTHQSDGRNPAERQS